MGSYIDSKIASVRDLTFWPLPASGRTVEVARVCRINFTTVFVDTKGRLYSTQVRDKTVYNLDSCLDDTLKACFKLGVLTKEAMEKHTQESRLIRIRRERRYAAKQMLDDARTLGIKLTAAQLRRLAEEMKAADESLVP